MPVVVAVRPACPRTAGPRPEAAVRHQHPPQDGIWYWFNGGEVHYRPKEYWQPGTKISVRLATGGLQWGYDGYGGKDLTSNFSIGDKIIMRPWTTPPSR